MASKLNTDIINYDGVSYRADSVLMRTFKPPPQYINGQFNKLYRQYEIICKNGKNTNWKTFIKLAEHYGMPPEYFVDERYYLEGKKRWRGYKIVFTAYLKHGWTPNQLFDEFQSWYENQRWKPQRQVRFEHMYYALRGGADRYGYAIYYSIWLCRFLEMPLGEVFQSYKSSSNNPVFAELHDNILRLNNKDIAVLASIAKALALYLPSEKKEIMEQMDRLLDLRSAQ